MWQVIAIHPYRILACAMTVSDARRAGGVLAAAFVLAAWAALLPTARAQYTVSLLAGSPSALSGSTNGVGSNAKFNGPYSLGLDPSDNIATTSIGT